MRRGGVQIKPLSYILQFSNYKAETVKFSSVEPSFTSMSSKREVITPGTVSQTKDLLSPFHRYLIKPKPVNYVLLVSDRI